MVKKKDRTFSGAVYELLAKAERFNESPLLPIDIQLEEFIPYCIAILEAKGHSVILKKTIKYDDIIMASQLVDLFYDHYDKKYPNDIQPTRNRKTDLRAASLFLKARQKATGYNKKMALADCADIILVLIENIELLGLETPLDFGILGQSKLKWITNRVINIINYRNSDNLTDEHLRLLEQCNDTYKGNHGLNLDLIIKKLEENDGKEKE